MANTYGMEFWIGTEHFEDCVALEDGMAVKHICESAESATGMTLDGTFDIPVLWWRTSIEIKAPGLITLQRFKQLADALHIAQTGEREVQISYYNGVEGKDVSEIMYCTSITEGTRVLATEYADDIAMGHAKVYLKGVSFQLQSKYGKRG